MYVELRIGTWSSIQEIIHRILCMISSVSGCKIFRYIDIYVLIYLYDLLWSIKVIKKFFNIFAIFQFCWDQAKFHITWSFSYFFSKDSWQICWMKLFRFHFAMQYLFERICYVSVITATLLEKRGRLSRVILPC